MIPITASNLCDWKLTSAFGLKTMLLPHFTYLYTVFIYVYFYMYVLMYANTDVRKNRNRIYMNEVVAEA